MARQYRPKHPQPKLFIAKYRERRGMKAKELADRLGISEGQQSRYESGETPVRLDYLNDVAQELGCTVAELLAGEPDDPTVQRAIELLRSVRDARNP